MRYACLFLLCSVACADSLTVPVGGDIQAALDQARPGDTVTLAAGVHRGRVVMRRSGEPGRPITLAGEPGAILDGSEAVRLDWRRADELAPGAWQVALPFEPFTITAEQKIITLLREDRCDPKNGGDANWHWPTMFQRGVGDHGWTGVRALALWLRGPKVLLVKFADGSEPGRLAMTVAPREPAVRIVGADRCVVRGLTIRNAAYGVFLEDTLGSVVEECVLGPIDYGVWLDNGSDRCTVRFCEMFLAPYGIGDPFVTGYWDNWRAHKTTGHYDRFGVQIHATAGGHRIHDNWIHDHWDGIEDRGDNRDLDIHHNRIETMIDDGLEPNGTEVNCAWHDNIVSGCICGFRIKTPRQGPLYAYRNIFFRNREDYRNYGEHELLPAKVYVYHNTSTSNRAIQSNKVFGIGTPNWHYFNNLFWCESWWGNTGNSVEPNWKADHNVYVRRGTSGGWGQGQAKAKELGLDLRSVWHEGAPGFVDLEQRNVALTADSIARGKGGDLRQLIGDLPGLPESPTPDAGALQFGEAMPQLPRPRAIVGCEPAGQWPPADAKRRDDFGGDNLLAAGGFEQGPGQFNRLNPAVHRLVTGDAAEGQTYLALEVKGEGDSLNHPLPALQAGRNYALVFWSRRCTVSDFRVIVRNTANAAYVVVGKPAPGDTWRRTVIGFVAPAAPVRLELSPRGPGRCEFDGFGLYEKTAAKDDDD